MGDNGDGVTAEKIEEEVGRVVEQSKEVQQTASNLLSKDEAAEQSVRQRAQSLDASIRRLRALIDSLLSSKHLDPKLADKVPTILLLLLPLDPLCCIFFV